MTSLVIAEHNNKDISPATLSTVYAATQLEQEIHILVSGEDCESVADQCSNISGINEIKIANNKVYKYFLPEPLGELITNIASNYSHILAPATTFGKNLMPRVSALLDSAQISDISGIISKDTFTRPIYAGNAIATVKCKDKIKIITVRSSCFDKAEINKESVKISNIEFLPKSNGSVFKGQELSKSERPELTSAKIIVSGGRGVGSSDDFKILEALADKLGAAVGASRAAVDAGYVPNDYQVGQTGKIVAPELYIAVGISGAIQHLAGMKDSKVIVAINKDEEAPIFQIADYGIVGDLFEIVPELTSVI